MSDILADGGRMVIYVAKRTTCSEKPRPDRRGTAALAAPAAERPRRRPSDEEVVEANRPRPRRARPRRHPRRHLLRRHLRAEVEAGFDRARRGHAGAPGPGQISGRGSALLHLLPFRARLEVLRPAGDRASRHRRRVLHRGGGLRRQRLLRQHHSRQGDRHRRLDGRRDHARLPRGHRPRRQGPRSRLPLRRLPLPLGRGREVGGRLSAQPEAGAPPGAGEAGQLPHQLLHQDGAAAAVGSGPVARSGGLRRLRQVPVHGRPLPVLPHPGRRALPAPAGHDFRRRHGAPRPLGNRPFDQPHPSPDRHRPLEEGELHRHLPRLLQADPGRRGAQHADAVAVAGHDDGRGPRSHLRLPAHPAAGGQPGDRPPRRRGPSSTCARA